MSTSGINASPQDTSEVHDQRVESPARDLVRATETRPDGRRLTRYRRVPGES